MNKEFNSDKKKRLIYGVGYFGCGNYKSKDVNGRRTKVYDSWYAMMRRCYSNEYQEKNPLYIGCKVCVEWHNFQVFAEWYERNTWDCISHCVDKDILIKGNKLYSPDTCVIVNREINNIFIKTNSKRGSFPIGVCYEKNMKSYTSQISTKNGRIKHCGFTTCFDAFCDYKQSKEKYIKQVADEYKAKYQNFPEKLYDAMCNWKVEIDD